MDRKIRLLAFMTLVAGMMFSLIDTGAQESTPPDGQGQEPPQSVEVAPGVTADNMVFLPGAEAPVNYRLSFEAGVVYEIVPGPNLELAYVESGSLVMTLDAAVTVGRLGDVDRGGLEVPANTEFTVGTGQFIVLQPGVGGEARNEGSGTAVVSIAGLTPQGSGVPVASPVATPVA